MAKDALRRLLGLLDYKGDPPSALLVFKQRRRTSYRLHLQIYALYERHLNGSLV
jgi:hypothetical protein